MFGLYVFRLSSSAGDIAKLKFPAGMEDLNLSGCEGVDGDLAQLQLPVGMKDLNLSGCVGVDGDLAQLQLPVGMKDLNLCGTGVTGKAKFMRSDVFVEYVID